MGQYEPKPTEKAASRNRCALDTETFRGSS